MLYESIMHSRAEPGLLCEISWKMRMFESNNFTGLCYSRSLISFVSISHV